MGPVGHRDLWESILVCKRMCGKMLYFQWVPSHVGLEGNEEADSLADLGRLRHPFNYEHIPKRPCMREARQLWDSSGLEEMQSDYEDMSDADSAGSESTEYEVRSVEAQEGLHDSWSLGSIGDSPQYLDSSDGGEEARDSKGKRARVL